MEFIAPIALWYSFGFIGTVWMLRAGHDPSSWSFAGALLGALVLPLAAVTRCAVWIRAVQTAPRHISRRPFADALVLLHVDDDPVDVILQVFGAGNGISSAHVVVVIPEVVRPDASCLDLAALAESLARYTCGQLTELETTSQIAVTSDFAAMRGSAGVALVSTRIIDVPFRGRRATQSRALAHRLGMEVVAPGDRWVWTSTPGDGPVSELGAGASNDAVCKDTSGDSRSPGPSGAGRGAAVRCRSNRWGGLAFR